MIWLYLLGTATVIYFYAWKFKESPKTTFKAAVFWPVWIIAFAASVLAVLIWERIEDWCMSTMRTEHVKLARSQRKRHR